MSFAYSPITLTGSSSSSSSSSTTSGAGVGVRVGPTGADYTTIGSAVAAAQTVLHIIGDVTEASTIQVPSSGLNIVLYNDALVSMGNFYFNAEIGESLHIEGDGTIRFGNTFGGTLFNGSGSLHVENIKIENTNLSAVCLTNIDYAQFDSVRFEGDVRICGDFNIYSDGIYRNGTVYFLNSANKSAVHGAVCENVLIIDSGTNSVISDILNG